MIEVIPFARGAVLFLGPFLIETFATPEHVKSTIYLCYCEFGQNPVSTPLQKVH